MGELAGGLLDLPADRSPSDAVLIFLAALGLRAEQWVDVGPRVVRDGHRYINWCGDLSVATVLGSKAPLYAGYWVPYCGWLRATGGFVEGWVAIQVVLSALTPVLVYLAGRELVGRWAGVVAGGAVVVQLEVYRWALRAQSEFALTLAVALALWRLTAYHTTPTGRNRMLALASLGFVAITRPNGLPIVAGYLAWDLLTDWSDRQLDLTFSAPITIAVGVSLVALMYYRLREGWAKGPALAHWKAGTIITPDRLVYHYEPVEPGGLLAFFLANTEHVVSIALLRVAWFFSPVMPGYGTRHAMTATVTLAPLLVGAVLGIRLAWRRDRQLLVLWGTPLAMVVLTVMVTWVPGWRNFLGPAVVVYALFAGYYVAESGWPDRLARLRTV